MKSNAIVRIILFSLAILVLLGILLAGLGLNSFMFRTDSKMTGGELPIASDGTVTQTVADASVIHNLNIEWVSGSITINADENASEITVAESFVESEKNRMVTEVSGDTLKIQFCRDSITFPSFGININLSKDLHITVPADWICDNLDIDTASANLIVDNLTINEMEFDGASATCDFSNCNVGELDMDGASGDIRFFGALNSLDFDGASGSCYLEVTNVPDRITMDGMSGDLEMTIPEECGFAVSIDALSGDFHSDFPTNIQNGNYIYGDGSCKISFDGMSGDLIIKKAQ